MTVSRHDLRPGRSPLSHRLLSGASLAAVLACGMAPAAHAQDRHWDANGTALEAGGTGTWDVTSPNWSPNGDGTSGPYSPWNNGALDTAILGGTAGTVTLGAPITIGNITFNSAGYVLTGGTLTLGGATPTITTSSGNAMINSAIAGTAGLTKAGGGSLTLGGVNSFAGNINLNAGSLYAASDAALGAAGNAIFTAAGIQTRLSIQGNTATNRTVMIGDGGTLIVEGEAVGSARIRGNGNVYVGPAGLGNSANIVRMTNDSSDYTGTTRFDGCNGVCYSYFSSIADLGVASSLGAPTTVANGTIVFNQSSQFSDNIIYIGDGDSSNRNWNMFGAAAILRNQGSGALTITGDIFTNGAASFNAESADINLLGVLSGANYAFSSLAGRAVTLGDANSFTGLATIGGTVRAGTLANSGVNSSLGAGTQIALDEGRLSYIGTGASSNRDWIGSGLVAITNDGSGALALGGNFGFLAGNPADSLTLGGSFAGGNRFDGVISGAGDLIADGAGSWVLNGANSFAGTVTVNNGTLRAGSASAFGQATNYFVNGGTLDLGGFNTTMTMLSGTGGTIALGAATLFVDGTVNSNFAGAITGTGGLTKRGKGVLTLTGANGYTGATTINGGTLALDFSGAGSPMSNIVSSSSALVMAGGALNVTGLASEANSQGFGGVTISAGNNNIGANAGAGGTLTVNLGAINRTGGLVDFAMNVGGTITTSNAALGGWATVNGSDYAKVVGGTITAFTAADYTNKDLAGTWLTGDIVSDAGGAANTAYSGSVTGSQQLGGLQYTAAAASVVAIAGSETLGVDGAILVSDSVGTFGQVIAGGSLTGATGGSTLGLRHNGGGLFIIGSTITDNAGAIAFTKAGTGTAQLAGLNSYTGATTLSGGRLELTTIANGGVVSSLGAASADSANLVLESGTLAYVGASNGVSDRGFTLVNGGAGAPTIEVIAGRSIEFSGRVTSADDAGLTKTGAGTLRLSNAANDYVGVTTVSGGTLSVGTLANGGVASDIGAATSASANLVLQDAGQLRYTGGNVAIDRGFTLASGLGRIDVEQAATTLTISGVATGAGVFAKDGAGTLVLSGANSYLGDTTVNGGTLRAGSATAFGAGNRLITVNAAGTLDLGGFDIAAGGVTGAGVINLGANTLTTAGLNSSFTGRITGTGGFTRGAGGPTQTLRGCASDYTGATTILGSLAIDCIANGGQSSSIGASSAASANLVFNNAFLTYDGVSAVTDRGFTLTGQGYLGVINAGVTLEFQGAVVGGGRLNKDGVGTLVLSGVNSNSGGLNVRGGVLRAGSATAFGGGGPATISNVVGAVLDLNGFDASFTYLGGGGLTGGAVETGGATISLATTGSGTVEFGGVISGGGSLVKGGTYVQRLRGCNNSYSGTTTINGGVLEVECLTDGGGVSSIGTSGAGAANLVINGGTLRYLGAGGSTNRRFTIGAGGATIDASGTGAIVFADTAPLTFAAPNAAQTLTLTGTSVGNNILAAQINNNGTGLTSLAKTGTGTWQFTNAASNYSGATTILGGVLAIDKLADGGLASSIGASAAAASNLVIGNGSTLRYTGTGDTTNRLFTLAAGVTYLESSGSGAVVFTDTGAVTLQGNNQARTIALGGTNTGNNTLAGSIGDAGSGVTTLAKNDAGAWILTGTNSYSGSTVINAGLLSIGNGGTSGAIASGIVHNGGTLAFNRSDSLTFGGNILGVGGMIQRGTGTTILTGTNGYLGGTTIEAGTLQLGNGGTSGSIVGDVANDGVLAINRSDNLTLNGGITGTGDLEQIGTGTTTLTGINLYNGATIVRDGTLRLAGGGQLLASQLIKVATEVGETGSFVVDQGIINTNILTVGTGGDMTVSNGSQVDAISLLLAGNALVTGTGSRLTGFDSIITGTMTVANGGVFGATTGLSLGNDAVLNIGGAAGAAATAAGTINAAEVAMLPFSKLNFNHTDAAYAFAPLISGGGSVSQTGTGTTILTATNSYTGGTTISAGTLQISRDANLGAAVGSLSIINGTLRTTATVISARNVALAGNATLLTDAGTGLLLSGTLSGLGGLTKSGAGELFLTGTNSYAGGTTISAGTLRLGNGTTTGSIIGDVANNGALIFHRSDNVAFGGLISGTGSVSKVGSSVLTLTGDNSYTGATTLTGGTVLINGDQSAATGLTTVNNGATLGGSGTIGGNVLVGAGGRLAPGNSPGTLTINGNLSLGAGSFLDFELGQADVVGGALNDLIEVGGDLTLDGTLNVAQSAGGSFGGGIYRLINYGGTLIDNGLLLGSVPAGSDLLVQTAIGGQVNLINAAGLALTFWDGAAGPKFDGTVNGGTGVWQANGGNNNWANAAGTVNAGFADDGYAVFAGTPGTVTIDNGLGAVRASGMQFASGGYLITGQPLTLTGTDAVIRVGDGTAAGAGFTATIASAINGAARLVKTDAGTLVLSGANSYSGGTLINEGTLSISSDANLGAAAGGITIQNGTLHATAGVNSNRAVTLTGAATLSVQPGFGMVMSGVIDGAGSLTKAGGLVILTGDNSYTGGTTISAGTLQIGASTTTGSIVGDIVNNASLVFYRSNDIAYGGAISGVGQLTQVGAGTLAMTGISSYTNATTVSAGRLLLQSGGQINATSHLSVGGGGEMIVDGTGSRLVAGPVISVIGTTANNSGTLTVRNGGTATFVDLDMANANNGTGTLNILGAGSTVNLNGGGTLGRLGTATINITGGGKLISSASALVGGQLATNSRAIVTVSGPGSEWNVTGAFNARRGMVTIADGGVVTAASGVIGFDVGIGPTNPSMDLIVTGAGSRFETSGTLAITNSTAGSSRGAITIADGGVVRVGGGTLTMGPGDAVLNIGSASGVPDTAGAGVLDAANITFAAATNSINFNHVDSDYVFAAAMSGAGSISHNGTGTTILTADNAYTGGASINSGALIINGDQTAATGTTTISFAGTLGGMGVIGGNVVGSGRINPGDVGTAPGTLTINGALTLTGSARLDYNFGQANVVGGPFNDLINVGGNLTLEGTLNVAVTPGGSFDPGVYRVINYGGTLTNNGFSVDPAYYLQTSVANQVNLVNTTGLTMRFWDGVAGARNDGAITGGTGVWQASVGGNDNWTEYDGSANAPYTDGAFAVFSGAPGVVTVDDTLGQVTAAGMQFASSGYVIQGSEIKLTQAESVIRVGDGTAAGAGYTATILSELTGTGGLVKADLGTLVLGGLNSYVGGTEIKAGTLQISTADNLGSGILSFAGGTLRATGTTSLSHLINFVGDGTISADSTTALTLDGLVMGAGHLTKAGNGKLIIATDADHVGGTTISAGLLQIGNGGTTGSLTGDVTNNSGLTFNRSDSTTFGGVISGSGFVIQGGAGTTILTAANSYTGGTGVNAGTLLINGDQSAATGQVTVGLNSMFGGIGKTGGDVVVANGGRLAPGSNGAGTLTILGNLNLFAGASLDFELGAAGVVGGALNDLISVGGNLTLDGTLNVSETAGGSFGPGIYRLINYGGALTDNGLVIGTTPSGSMVSVQTAVAGQVNLVNTAGLTLSFWDGDAGPKFDGAVNGGNGVWRVGGGLNDWTDSNGAVNADYAQNSFAIFSAAPGTVTVDNGGGNVLASGMQFASDGYVVTGDALTLTGAEAIIQVGDSSAAGAGYSATIGAELTGAATLVKTDAGTLILTADNSYAGGTTINAGTLQIGNGGVTGNIVGDVTNNGQLVFDRTRDLTYAGVISGMGRVEQAGPNALILTGNHSYTGGTLISEGSITLGNGGTSGSIIGDVLTNGGLIFNRSDSISFGGAISGTGSVSHSGTGTTTLTGTNSYKDLTLVTAGTLLINGDQSAATGQTSVFSGAKLGGTGTIGGNVVIGSGGVLTPGAGGAGTLTIGGGLNLASGATLDYQFGRANNPGGPLNDLITVGGDLTLDGTIDIAVSAGGSFDIGLYRVINYGGALTDNGLDIGAAPAGSELFVQTSVAGQVNLVNTGGALLNYWDGAAGPKFNGAVDGGNGIWQSGAGNANWADATGAVNAGFDDGAFAIFAGQAGTVTIDNSLGAVTASGMQFATDGYVLTGGALTLTGAQAVIRVGDGSAAGAGYSATIGADLIGTSELVKSDAGTLILSGSGSHSGGTRVNGGTLWVNGDYSGATGAVRVDSGAALGGTGIIGGDVAIADGGILSPGAGGAGTLTIGGGLTLASGSKLAFEFGAADVAGGALNDLVTVGGNLILDGTIDVTVPAGGAFGAGVYRVFDYGGTLTDNGLALGAMPGGGTVTVQTAINGQVNLVNDVGPTLTFWDGAAGPKNDGAINGGNGVWQASGGNDNWTSATGALNAPYADGGFAIFGGSAGTVTVDNSLGAVTSGGMQFAANGYVIDGDAITLNGAATTIRVGDGTNAGAGFTATIKAALTGASQLVKSDAGTLILSGSNSYTGGTAITGGTVQIGADAHLGDAAGDVTLNGGTLATSADLSSARDIILAGAGTIAAGAGTTFTYGGLFAGAGALTKAGAGTLLVTADNSGFGGGTTVAAGTLAVCGSLGGAVSVGAAGRLEGTGSVGSIVNAGVVAPGSSIGTLTVAGDYRGNGGVLEIEAELGGDASAADRLVVGGATSGDSVVRVTNRGGLGAQTVEGVKIIDVTGASDGRFTLDGDYLFDGEQAVIAGAYGYRLYKNGVSTPTDGDWYLRSALIDDAGEPEGPLYQPGVPVYEAYVGALQSLNGLPTLQQRVGNRSWAGTPGADGTGIWGRFESQRLRPESAFSTSGADRRTDGWQAQMGVDTLVAQRADGAALVAGVTAHYGSADTAVTSTFGNGLIDTQGYGLGATLTWYGPQGFYADGQAKMSWFDSDLASDVLGSLAEDNHGKGRAFSVEVGKRSAVGGNLTVTPQVQMSYSRVTFDRFTDPSDAVVSADKGASLKTRWGMTLDHQKQWGTSGEGRRTHLYATVNLAYEWLGDARVDVSGTAIEHREERLRGELGVGGSYSWGGGRFALYTEVSGDTAITDFGEGYSLKGTAGLRMRF